MKTVNLCLAILLATTVFISCKKAAVAPEDTQQTFSIKNNKVSVLPSIVTNTRNLTVVYLVPSDQDTLAGYKTRLSGVLHYVQNWYKEEMTRNGYQDKTFGLVKDPSNSSLVQITRIPSTQNAAYFRDSDGYFDYDKTKTAVEAYFSAHPGLKTSQHYLVMVPPIITSVEAGNPYTGFTHVAYFRDNITELDMDNFVNHTASISGFAHELGHSFNMPHDMETKSENTAGKKSLMGGNLNYVMGYEPVILTSSEAAIANNCEVFNGNSSQVYYNEVTADITKLNFNYNPADSTIVLSGKFTTTGDVAKVIVYYNRDQYDAGYAANSGYDAVTQTADKIGTDSFRVVLNVNELHHRGDNLRYQFSVNLLFNRGGKEGRMYEEWTECKFSGGIPTKPELSKTDWSIASVSSEATNEPAPNGLKAALIDDNHETYWHSKWATPSAPYPHTIVIKFGSNKTAKGVILTPRNSPAYMRAIKDFKIEISNNNQNYTLVNSNAAENYISNQYFDFGSAKTFKYLRLTALSPWIPGSTSAALAEIGLSNY